METYITGGAGGTALPKTEFDIARDDQSASISVLEELVTKFASRLAPVLNPDQKLEGAGGDGDTKTERVPAPIIGTMRYHTNRIEVANDRMSELLDRLCI